MNQFEHEECRRELVLYQSLLRHEGWAAMTRRLEAEEKAFLKKSADATNSHEHDKAFGSYLSVLSVRSLPERMVALLSTRLRQMEEAG